LKNGFEKLEPNYENIGFGHHLQQLVGRFSKNLIWRLDLISFILDTIFTFRFFPQTMRLVNIKQMQKKYLKNVESSQIYAEKSDFNPPSWIDPQFLGNLTRCIFESCFWLK
jgi:hypothetical protein